MLYYFATRVVIFLYSKAEMSENPCPRFFKSMTHFYFFKKLKRLKPHEPSVALVSFLFFSFCLCLFFFLLDYRTVNNNTVSGLRGPSFFVSWFGINESSLVENEKMGFLENDCDIFDGNWVWDESYPLYQSKDCMFLDEGFRCSENGRPDNFYTKWRWQPKHCDLPRFDAKHMLEKLRNQRVVFVGDSIGRNQWESLLCLLSSAVSDNSSIYEVNGSPITKHTGSLIFKFKDYNCTVEYYRAPFLVLQSRPPAQAPHCTINKKNTAANSSITTSKQIIFG